MAINAKIASSSEGKATLLALISCFAQYVIAKTSREATVIARSRVFPGDQQRGRGINHHAREACVGLE